MVTEGGGPHNFRKYLTAMQTTGKLYADVILPLKFGGESTYLIPGDLSDRVVTGCRVRVNFSNREYTAVVSRIYKEGEEPERKVNIKKINIKEIISVESLPLVTSKELELWKWVSEYYMCTPGEVYKAAYPWKFPVKFKEESKKNEAKEAGKEKILPEPVQSLTDSFTSVRDYLKDKHCVLLSGAAESSRDQILLRIISEYISLGKNILYMVPEIALGDEIYKKLRNFFPENLVVYHSKLARGEKYRVNRMVSGALSPFLLLGTRSSIFLPFNNLSLIIVDQEHDPSYKQSDPAPRYNGRDCALILAKIFGTGVLLSSATPSLESLKNSLSGRYKSVQLMSQAPENSTVPVEIIDTLKERKKRRITGEIPDALADQIRERISKGEQVMVYINRRAYSPYVQCIYCGKTPCCPRCNIPFSFHKSTGELKCHYCGTSVRFNTICKECGRPGLKERGAGTEKIEESLGKLVPGTVVVRLDQDISGSKSRQEKVLREFREHKAGILVGTQMLGRGFNFSRLTLVCILRGESMLSLHDFRATERALQTIEQLCGRINSKAEGGKMVIETSRASDPFFVSLATLSPEERVAEILAMLLRERQEFEYPPFTRQIKISLRSLNREKLDRFSQEIQKRAVHWNVMDFTGPYTPASEMIRGEHQLQFRIRLKREISVQPVKQEIRKDISGCARLVGSSVRISVDVDPY